VAGWHHLTNGRPGGDVTAPTPPEAPPAAPQQPAQPPEGQPAAPVDQNVDALPSWAREAITKANREAASYRTQVQELKPRADQFAALEEASKSELQRIQEAHDAERTRAEQFSAEALRMRVALEHGINKDDLDLLGSGTEEQITARAQRIAALHAAQQAVTPTPPPAPNSPTYQPGATPTPPPGSDVAARHAQFFPHRPQ
jgi:hypothetical protein